MTVIEPPRRRWTTDEFHKMAEFGILGEDERLELIDGEVIELAPIGPAHRRASLSLYDHMRDAAGSRHYVMHESPISLADGSEPQPDIAVALGSADDYEDRHPSPSDLVLVVEASDTTLAADRSTKMQLYADAGIHEFWIVNLVDGQVEVYRQSSDGRFAPPEIYVSGQTVSLPFASGTIAVADILPRKLKKPI